jgi:hypothetical protein
MRTVEVRPSSDTKFDPALADLIHGEDLSGEEGWVPHQTG